MLTKDPDLQPPLEYDRTEPRESFTGKKGVINVEYNHKRKVIGFILYKRTSAKS